MHRHESSGTAGAQESERVALFAQGESLIRATLRFKSGCTLSEDDLRPENQALIDLAYEVRARLWERLTHPEGEVLSHFKAYVRRMAANAWADYLRERHPVRESLRHRLAYFVKTHEAHWHWQQDEAGDRWLTRGRRVESAPDSLPGQAQEAMQRLAALCARGQAAGSLRPPVHWERMQAGHWDAWLAALWQACEGPLELDALVSAFMTLVGVAEVQEAAFEDDAQQVPGDEASAPDPQQQTALRQMLSRAWSAITHLKAEHRAALLLNPPSVGTRKRPGGQLRARAEEGAGRAEVAVFPAMGIATVSEVGRQIGWQSEHFAQAWELIDCDAQEKADLAALGDNRARFQALWDHLPLADAQIARICGLRDAQQVINRRAQACEQLRRQLADLRSALH